MKNPWIENDENSIKVNVTFDSGKMHVTIGKGSLK